MRQPGAATSGLRRPSSVGPVPPTQIWSASAPLRLAVTQSEFLAFSGLVTIVPLLAAWVTSVSSFSHCSTSMAREPPS